MKRFLIILFCLLVVLDTALATIVSGNIMGTILDRETNEPIEYASVAVFKKENQELIAGTITGQDGRYLIKGLENGLYYIEITFVGYDKKILENIEINSRGAKIDLGDIRLTRSIAKLNEVEVVADEMSVEFKIDKKVINVSQQLTAVSGTAVDILENLPSITVDAAGNVSLRGSTGILVLIDGRLTVLEPSEALHQMPSNIIDKIEIITNPSARYNPDGTAGIINIVTKKNKLKGLSGNINLNVGNYNRYGGNLLLNYASKKWNVFLGADVNNIERPGYLFQERITYKNDTTYFTRSEGEENRKRHLWLIRGAMGYRLSDKDYADFEFYVGNNMYESSEDLDYEEGIKPAGINNEYASFQYRKIGGDFYSLNGSYQHDFNEKGHKIVAQVQYRARESSESTQNDLTNTSGNIISGQLNIETGPVAILQTNVDYTLPLESGNKFEAGYQSRLGKGNDKTDLYWYNPGTGEYELQPQYSNDTDYRRDIHSLYAIFGGNKGLFGYQLGFRGEYTYRVVSLTSEPDDYIIDRFDYFPSVHLSLKIPERQRVLASYSRRIQRPRSWYLEPFITWRDAFNVRQGKPGLQPEYIDAMEIGYNLDMGDHTFAFEGYYRITNNKTEWIRSVYYENVMMYSPENVGKDYALGGEISLAFNFFKWWKIDLSGNFYNYRLNGSYGDQVFDRQSFNWTMRLGNTFRLFKGNRIQFYSRYNSATVTAQGTRGDYWIADLAMSQQFWKKRMTGILQVWDIFGKVTRDQMSSGPDFYNYNESYAYAPRLSFTLKYSFNNYKKRKSKAGDVDDDDF